MMSDASNRRRFPADNVGALKRGKHGVAIAGAAIILLFFSDGSFAEGVEVRGDDGGKHVLIKVDDMTMDAVLDGLQKRYGFAIEGLSNVQSDEFSEVMDGSLDDVLERLLRNRNHMIVHSAEIKAGISKVMILNSDYGIAPPDENSDGQPHRIDPVDSGEP